MSPNTLNTSGGKESKKGLKKAVKGLSRNARALYDSAQVYYRIAAGSSHTANTVFVWIPKTAGTSLFKALESHLGMVNLCASINHVKAFKNTGSVTFGHWHYRSLVDAGLVSRAFHESAFKFCVVRDPYDRALSLYYYLRRKKGRSSLDFLGFLNQVYMNRPPVGMYNYLGLSQTNPQVDWLMDDNGRFVVDRIYRFEALDRIEEDFSKIFGLSDFSIGHTNQVKRDHSSEDILSSHSEIVPLIEEIYARDFYLLDYPKKSAAENA